jgi:hypothetical protein
VAYAVVHQFPGGTKEQYEASIAAVHPSDGSLPEGQMFHAAGPCDGGWMIIVVPDSQASWERFRDDILKTRLQGIESFPIEPEEIAGDLHTLQQSTKGRSFGKP